MATPLFAVLPHLAPQVHSVMQSHLVRTVSAVLPARVALCPTGVLGQRLADMVFAPARSPHALTYLYLALCPLVATSALVKSKLFVVRTPTHHARAVAQASCLTPPLARTSAVATTSRSAPQDLHANLVLECVVPTALLPVRLSASGVHGLHHVDTPLVRAVTACVCPLLTRHMEVVARSTAKTPPCMTSDPLLHALWHLTPLQYTPHTLIQHTQ